jgi:vacuolar-type H+-ATPase subunit I/STV1
MLKILELDSKDKLKKAEGYSILSLFIGAATLSLGIGLSILNTKGIPAILAMLGSLWAFLSTIGLIIVWLMKEWRSE